jgi:hypothetical protein
MSKVSFINTDITRIRFSDKIAWGGKDKFTVVEENWLEDSSKKGKNNVEKRKTVSLAGVLSVYKNLHENYELRIRHDEADMLFIREMELNRKYRPIYSKVGYNIQISFRKNNWFRRNIFSFIGLYHILSNYGASLFRPILASIIIILSFSLVFVSQSNTDLVPTYDSNFTWTKGKSISNDTSHFIINNTRNSISSTTYSRFIGFSQFGNATHWRKAVEKTIADFLPLLSIPSDIKVVLIDYIIKIIGNLITLGVIAISAKSRFNRKFAP